MTRRRQTRKAAARGPKVVDSQNSRVDIRLALKHILESDDGRVLWAWLHNRCGFTQTSMTRRVDGEIAPLATECKEAQRMIYLELRSLAPAKLRVAAEEFSEQRQQMELEEKKKDARTDDNNAENAPKS